MSTSHKVTLPDGKTATRTSEKHVYTHVVVRGPELRSDIVDRKRRNLEHVEYSEAISQVLLDYVNGGGELVKKDTGSTLFSTIVLAPGLPNQDPYRGLGWIGHDGTFMTSPGETLADQVLSYFGKQAEGHHAYAIVLREQIAEVEAGPELVGPWTAVTWSSRLKLAESAANRLRGGNQEIRVLETERHTK